MQYYDYYLQTDTSKKLLEQLRNVGFEWYDYDEMGLNQTKRDPKRMEVVSIRGLGDCIYLEHIVDQDGQYDEEGNVISPTVFTTTFHANVRLLEPHDFPSAIVPNHPKYKWA